MPQQGYRTPDNRWTPIPTAPNPVPRPRVGADSKDDLVEGFGLHPDPVPALDRLDVVRAAAKFGEVAYPLMLEDGTGPDWPATMAALGDALGRNDDGEGGPVVLAGMPPGPFDPDTCPAVITGEPADCAKPGRCWMCDPEGAPDEPYLPRGLHPPF